jgi:2',3'-cyclic-nucleotide 2'-phosphodiesterase (5'-nucleotidase family)
MKAGRPGALLLDGGDTWQGSATSLWTNAQDVVDACKLPGVDVMTGHWEFTYGMARVKEIVEKDYKGRIEFLAQNLRTNDFGGHTHDAVPVAVPVANAGGKALVTNAGSNGKGAEIAFSPGFRWGTTCLTV